MWGLLLFLHSLPLRWWLEDCRNLNLFIYISVLSSLFYVFVFVCVNIFSLSLSVRFSSSFHVILLLSFIGYFFKLFLHCFAFSFGSFSYSSSRGFLVQSSFLSNHHHSFLSHLLPSIHIISLVLCIGLLQYISHRVHLICYIFSVLFTSRDLLPSPLPSVFLSPSSRLRLGWVNEDKRSDHLTMAGKLGKWRKREG